MGGILSRSSSAADTGSSAAPRSCARSGLPIGRRSACAPPPTGTWSRPPTDWDCSAAPTAGRAASRCRTSGSGAGTTWDTIEIDHAVGVGRKWAKAIPNGQPLIVVTADHDQTMSILGAVEISDADLTNREPVASGRQMVYRDAVTNLRSDLTTSSLPAEVTKGAGRAQACRTIRTPMATAIRRIVK
jgi:hypothetical protein